MVIIRGGSDAAHYSWASQSLRYCPAAGNILTSVGFNLQCSWFPIFLTSQNKLLANEEQEWVSVQAPRAANSPPKSVSLEVRQWAQLITLQHPRGQDFRSDLFHWLRDQFLKGGLIQADS